MGKQFGFENNQVFSCVSTPKFSALVILHTSVPMKIEQIECSETLAFKLQMLVNHSEESIQHSERGESLKSRNVRYVLLTIILFAIAFYTSHSCTE
jgi:hypothetical protein